MAFVAAVEPRLRQALVASYGPIDGSDATADALSWAWEHWDRLASVSNKPAYLYRVGQSSTRRNRAQLFPAALMIEAATTMPELSPDLLPALARLSVQQRTTVLLVYAYGWKQSEVADLMEINPSTVREHLNRALARLRSDLEVHDNAR